MADINTIFQMAADTGLQIQRSNASGKSVRAYLTDPGSGIQTIAGANLAEIIRQYGDIKASGRNSPAVVQAVIRAIETIRSSFERQVRALGGVAMGQGGNGAIDTINRVAALLTADRERELEQLGGTVSGTGLSTAGLDLTSLTSSPMLLIGIVLLIVFLLLRKG